MRRRCSEERRRRRSRGPFPVGVSAKIAADDAARIEEMASAMDVSRAEVVRRLIQIALVGAEVRLVKGK